MNPLQQAYAEGFMEKCAMRGIDPETLFKSAGPVPVPPPPSKSAPLTPAERKGWGANADPDTLNQRPAPAKATPPKLTPPVPPKK